MNYGLIFVETRNIPDLDKKIYSMLEYLPDNFTPFVYCSDTNKEQFDKFEYRIAPKIESKSDYDYFLTNPKFWLMSFDKVLIIQHDAGLLRKGIEEFYYYDYVGAPWYFQDHGGNGGLSWRNPKVMHDIASKFQYSTRLGHEDVFFCNIMYSNKMNLASREACSRFSVETVFKLGTLGYHNIRRWLKPEECKQILNQYETQ